MADGNEKATERGIVPGAIVQLKSGGPQMTVESVGNYTGRRKASCSWFIDGKQETNLFTIPSLKVVSDD